MAACGLSDVTLLSGEEQIVVQGVLNAQAAEQVLWIERTTPAGELIEFGLRPLRERPSRVEVRAEGGGDVFAFLADTANPARFVATFTPVHGRRYDLLVEAGGAVLRAATVVPPRITIVDPPADTVSHPRNTPFRVSWASGTSRDVAIYVTSDTGEVSRYTSFPMWVRDDTVAVVGTFPVDSRRRVWVVAADSVTARLYAPPVDDGPRLHEGNVAGGAGVFGAIATDRVLMQVP